MERGFDYDDVLVKPNGKLSGPISRDEVNLGYKYKNLQLKIPIVASPMKGIISKEIITKIANLGGIGIMHRFYDTLGEQLDDLYSISNDTKIFGVSTKIDWYTKPSDLMFLQRALENKTKVVVIDSANGYLLSMIHSVAVLYRLLKNINVEDRPLIMAGNVVDFSGAFKLAMVGCDLIRVGIGSGQLCTTRNNTGIGVPQISALQSCNKFRLLKNNLVSDGGINNPDKAVKSFVAGASLVMVGSAFARSYESAHNGIIYGMASRKLQEEYYHSVKSIEGKEALADKNISLGELITDWVWNIKSAGTYLGARNIKDYNKNGRFIQVK